MNSAKPVSFGKVMIKLSGFLLMSGVFAGAVNASCPDPEELHPQKGAAHPRWITDSGWISDAEAQVIKGSKPKLVRVYVVDLPPPAFFSPSIPKPIHELLCSYSNGQSNTIIFNMREPFGHSSFPIIRNDLEDWDVVEMAPSESYRSGYVCVFGSGRPGHKRAKCEFTFGYRDVGNYQDPFDSNPETNVEKTN